MSEVHFFLYVLQDVVTVIHLPARHASQAQKFPNRRTNLVLHASIWTQTIRLRLMSFPLLAGISQDAEIQIRIKFANIHLHNQSYFPLKTEKIVLF